jgi:hypothetical protein
MRNVSGASGAGELFRRIIDSIDSSFVDTQEIVEEKHKQAVSLLSPVAGSIFILDPSRDNEAVITLLGDEPKNYTWELEGDGKILPLKTFRIPLKKGTWMLYGRPKYPSGNKLTSPFSVEEQ